MTFLGDEDCDKIGVRVSPTGSGVDISASRYGVVVLVVRQSPTAWHEAIRKAG